MKLTTSGHGGAKAFWALFFVFLYGITAFQVEAQGYVWTSQIGMSGVSGEHVAVDATGNAYVAGGFQGTAQFGNTNLTSTGGYDVFIAKFDSGGHLLWVKQAGGTGDDVAQDIAVDTNGNVCLIGRFQGTATFDSTNLTAVGSLSMNQFLTKYSSTGALIWARQSGGQGGGGGNGIAVDHSGNLYSTGYYLDFNGWYSIVIDKWNSSGLPVWHQQVAGLPNYSFPLQGNSIKADAAGNVYVTGEFATQVTMGTSTLSTPSNFGTAVFIAKLNQNGNFVWAEQPAESGLPEFDTGTSLALDGSGNVLVVGTYGGTLGFGTNQLNTPNSDINEGFIVKCDTSGSYLWAQQTSQRNGGSCSSCTADSGGNVYVSGNISTLAFLEKYDSNGNPVWELGPSNAGSANGYSTAVDVSNRVLQVTLCSGNISFDNESFTNIGGADIFVSQVSEQIPPVFLTQPQNSPVGTRLGSNYTFNASTRSVYPVNYQWQFEGTNVNGTTNASLVITNIQLPNQGNYFLIASNAYGSSTSVVAQLTIYLTATLIINGNGQVSMNPNGAVYPANSLVTFTAVANSGDAFLGWSGDLSGTDSVISIPITTNMYVVGSFADSLTNIIIDDFDRRATFDGGWSAANFFNEFGNDSRYTAASNSPTFSATYRPVITVPGPYDVFVWYPGFGSWIGFSTNAPWSVVCDSGTFFTNIDETTNGGSWRLIASGLLFSAGTNGFVSLSNNSGESPSTLVIADAVRFFPSQSPLVTTNPQSLIAKVGSNVTFSVGVSGSPPFTYQWVFNGTNCLSGNTSTLTIPYAKISNTGQYSVTVSNFLGSASSSNAILTLISPNAPVLGTPSLNSNGQIQIGLNGDSGVLFAIEVSTNLADWVTLTNVFNASGSSVFFDMSGDSPAKFYRAAWGSQ